MRETIPILGPSVKNQSVQVNNQLTLNLYPRVEPSGSKTQIALYHTPGLESIDESQAGDGRSNGVVWDDKLYFVIGDSLVSIDSSDTVTAVGTLNTSSGRVSIAAGRNYICLVDGTNGYTWNGSAFAVIGDSDFPDDATHVEYIDGFFIVNDSGTDDFYKSALEDPTDWASLDFETASAAPDDILAIGRFDRDLFVVGERSTQRYYNSGNADFPFTPYPRSMELGILAPHSIVRTNYGLFWLANIPDGDAVIVQVTGEGYQVVSDVDTSSEISRLTTKTDAIGSVYTQEGHTFYVLTFPSDQLTKVYDVTQGIWHDRSSDPLGKWRVSGLGYLSGRVIGTDFTNGKIYNVSRTVYTDDGTRIERKRRSQIVHSNRREFACYRLELEFEFGVGTGDEQTPGANDPQCEMRYSWNGHEYSNTRPQPIGAIGEYDTRAVWYEIGDGVNLSFEFEISDPVPVTVIGGYADIEMRDF